MRNQEPSLLQVLGFVGACQVVGRRDWVHSFKFWLVWGEAPFQLRIRPDKYHHQVASNSAAMFYGRYVQGIILSYTSLKWKFQKYRKGSHS